VFVDFIFFFVFFFRKLHKLTLVGIVCFSYSFILHPCWTLDVKAYLFSLSLSFLSRLWLLASFLVSRAELLLGAAEQQKRSSSRVCPPADAADRQKRG